MTFSWAEIPEVNMSILHPTDFIIYRGTNDTTLAYYSFQRINKSKWNSLYLSSLIFSDKNSTLKSAAECPTREIRCSPDEINAVKTFDNLLANFKRKKDYEDYHFITLAGQNYFVHESECEGDLCVSREYITFKGNIEINIGSFWWRSESNREKLDRIISLMAIR
jgi:hypothetical protein